MSKLSPAQELAATKRGAMLVAACPGAGKTTVLKHRAEILLQSNPGSRLAAVTFTAEAAASLKLRITQQYPPAKSKVDAGTFHSLCGAQLRRAGQHKPLIGEAKSAMWIRLAIEECPIKEDGFDVAEAQEAIQAWQREISPDIPSPNSSAAAWVFERYTQMKAKNGVRDFGDLILDAVLGMRNDTVPVLDVAFMLVDEFQDTDNMQLEWVLEHSRRGIEVTIVGDDDQAIYGWRGSLGYEGMLRFQSEAEASLVTLDRTFRCTLDVLRPAAILINHNTARVAKKLVTSNPNTGTVQVRTFADREEEVTAIIRAISASDQPESWAVIARTNALLDELESRIPADAFAFTRSGGRSFWEQRAPSMLLSMAASMANRDMMGIGELLQHARVRSSTLDALSERVRFDARGALDRFLSAGPPKSCSSNDRHLIKHLQAQARQWDSLSTNPGGMRLALNGMAQAIHKVYPWRTADHDEAGKRLAHAAESLGSMNGSLQQRVNAMSRRSKRETKGASLLTMHASKGLEFDHVWIMGVEEGVLPSVRDGSDIEEERRLLYVGITRAKDDLTLSYTLDRAPSKFLREARLLGVDLLES